MRIPAAAIMLAAALAGCDRPDEAGMIRVTIPRGATAGQIADTLEARGVIAHAWWFRMVSRLRGTDARMKSGTYDLPQGARPLELLEILVAGQEAQQRLAVPEGMSLLELTELVEGTLAVSADSLTAAAADSRQLQRVAPEASTLEGYLYPETYLVPVTIDARRLVAVMVSEFLDNWQDGWTARLDTLGMTRHQVVTLASIVEGEALVDEERPIVAAVYLNRLQRGMRLQADPTVQYAIQQATGQRKSRLFVKDYQFESPYNTYLIDGLPPGPISSPGRASMEAVLYPDSVDYLYFVADNTGGHVFTRSYREHLQAIRRIRGTAP